MTIHLGFLPVPLLPGLLVGGVLIPGLAVSIAVYLTGAGLLKWAFMPSPRLPRRRTLRTRIRIRLHLHPGRGHASRYEIAARWSAFASFRESGRVRRSLSGLARWTNTAQHAIYIGRSHLWARIWLTLQEHVIVTSPPRKGKSGWLGTVIAHYPGAVLSTTTRADLFELTSPVRAEAGPVHVFNPQGVGVVRLGFGSAGATSTFRWNPVQGCEDPATAIRRGQAFAYSVSTKGATGADDGFWNRKASDYLSAFFCAAALAGGDMRHVMAWVSGRNADQAIAVLGAAGRIEMAASLAQLVYGKAEKTAATVTMVMSNAMAFMTDPRLAASVLPAEGDGFDIAAFLAARGTLYMIAQGQGEESPVAPLFACLANECHYVAGLIGSAMPGGRLDPGLLMALDEVTQICPVALDKWSPDSGGKGIQIISVVHGYAQLEARWGKQGAQTIMNTSGLRMVLPGITDMDTLTDLSKLCGEASFKVHGEDKDSVHPVMTTDEIRRMPAKCALLIRGDSAPVVVHLPMAWNDRDVKTGARTYPRGLVLPAPAPPRPMFSLIPPDTDGPDDPELMPGNGLDIERGDADEPGDGPWRKSA